MPRDIPIYNIGNFSSSQSSSTLYQVEPFDSTRSFKVTYPHRHDNFFEILFLISGHGTHTIDFHQHQIKPYSIFFLSPGQIHELDLSPDVRGFIFLFTADFYHFNKTDTNKLYELPYFFQESMASPLIYLVDEDERQSMLSLFKNAVEENLKNETDKIEIIRAYLDIILIFCKRKFTNTHQIDEKLQKGRLLVRKFKQLIEEKSIQNISIKQYADLLNISPSHLSEVVKSVTGRTSTDLVNDRLLLEIKRLLKYSDLTITEIAYKLNFSDQSYFAKYVKKMTEYSPKQLRDKLIKS
jgi:AraC-like DNA-binding protein